MIAKLVCHASSRIEAIQKLKDAIRSFRVKGVETTLPFGYFVCENEAFRTGDFDTHFVNKYFSPEALQSSDKELSRVAAKLAIRAWISQTDKLTVAKNSNAAWFNSRHL